MKELVLIQACPCDDYYIWQTHAWLESLKTKNLSDKAISLVFTPDYRDKNPKWETLEKLYPEAEFFYYKDDDNISKILSLYIPLLRPYILMKYFRRYPEMSEKAVYYCDNDTLVTDKFDLSLFIDVSAKARF